MFPTLTQFSHTVLLTFAAGLGVAAAWLLWPADEIADAVRRWQDWREARRFNETIEAFKADGALSVERMRDD